MVSHNVEINHVKVLILKSLYRTGFGVFSLSFLSAGDRELDMLIFGGVCQQEKNGALEKRLGK